MVETMNNINMRPYISSAGEANPELFIADDFRSPEAEPYNPYLYVLDAEDPKERAGREIRMRDKAKEFKITKSDFDKMLSAVKRAIVPSYQQCDLENVKIYMPPDWSASNVGIYHYDPDSGHRTCACSHLIVPVAVLQNANNGLAKIKISFSRGKVLHRMFVIDAQTLFNKQKIISLSDYGVDVSSESAGYLVQWMQAFMAVNISIIPTLESVSKLGWNKDEFIPYSSKVEFDGDVSFTRMFNAIAKPAGTFTAWLEAVNGVVRASVFARLVMAAAFAAPLLCQLNAVSAFFHLWSSMSSTGKTVLLMMAASIFGNPDIGGYVQTAKTTDAGAEFLADFLNNFPVFMDELQLAKDNRGRLDFNVYKLAQGSGKTRGKRGGSMAYTPCWKTMFITSGESPIVGNGAGSGAFARAIQCEITETLMSRKHGNKIVYAIKKNYGHAGRMFIASLPKYINDLPDVYNSVAQQLTDLGAQSKQAMTGAALLVAMQIAAQEVFRDELCELSTEDIMPFLRTNDETNISSRALELIDNTVFANLDRFSKNSVLPRMGEISLDESDGFRHVFIITGEVRKILEDAGMSYDAVLSELSKNGRINSRKTNKQKENTIAHRIDGNPTRCVEFLLDSTEKL